ncbi:MAG: hypothetical protein ABIH23_02485 [bacterium]
MIKKLSVLCIAAIAVCASVAYAGENGRMFWREFNADEIARIRELSLKEYASELAANVVDRWTHLGEGKGLRPGFCGVIEDVTPPTQAEVEEYAMELMTELGGEEIDFENTSVGAFSDTIAQGILDLVAGLNDTQKKLIGIPVPSDESEDELTTLSNRVILFIAREVHHQYGRSVLQQCRADSDEETEDNSHPGFFFCPGLGDETSNSAMSRRGPGGAASKRASFLGN